MVTCDVVFKFIVVGCSGTGKSAISRQFADQRFSAECECTIGVDMSSRTISINGQQVKLQTWDTGGQEKYLSITRKYFRGSQGVLLVYDVTSRESFEKLEWWLDNIHQYSNNKNIVIYLVGNKSDLVANREVQQTEGEKFSRKNGLAGFLETSAKTAENIEVVFTNLAIEIYDKMEAGAFHANNQVNGVKLVPQQYVSSSVEYAAKRRNKCHC